MDIECLYFCLCEFRKDVLSRFAAASDLCGYDHPLDNSAVDAQILTEKLLSTVIKYNFS